ncbi:MAG: helix-turn-helix transcriptional regulator [Mariniphaga sp.]
MNGSELTKLLGARIRKLREEQNISQQDLAALCNFEKSNMARIESGRTNPTFLTLVKISVALKVSLPALVDLDPDRS